jgi:prefoldin subunit 5
MIKRISAFEDAVNFLQKEGKRIDVDPQAYHDAMKKVSEQMEFVRRDFKQKDSESQKSASQVILTA